MPKDLEHQVVQHCQKTTSYQNWGTMLLYSIVRKQ